MLSVNISFPEKSEFPLRFMTLMLLSITEILAYVNIWTRIQALNSRQDSQGYFQVGVEDWEILIVFSLLIYFLFFVLFWSDSDFHPFSCCSVHQKYYPGFQSYLFNLSDSAIKQSGHTGQDVLK